jgi:WD40 repeat protein
MLAVGAFGGHAREVSLYEVATGKERCRFEGHLSGIRAVAFSSDGRTLATAGEDSTVLLWDLTRAPATGPAKQRPPEE